MGQTARFSGHCPKCEKTIIKDKDVIEKDSDGYWVHVNCPNYTRTKLPRNKSSTEQTIQTENAFHGFHLMKPEFLGEFILDQNYEKTDFIELSNDYHGNFNKYDYVLCKVPLQHKLLNCSINKPASINDVAYRLLSKLDKIKNFQRPVVFGIIGKGSGQTMEKASNTALKVIGKINRRKSTRAAGFGSNMEYFLPKSYKILVKENKKNKIGDVICKIG